MTASAPSATAAIARTSSLNEPGDDVWWPTVSSGDTAAERRPMYRGDDGPFPGMPAPAYSRGLASSLRCNARTSPLMPIPDLFRFNRRPDGLFSQPRKPRLMPTF